MEEAEADKVFSIKIVLTKIAFVVWFLLFFLPVSSQIKPDIPFISGERITYSAYYNWHFIWIKSGEVNFQFADSLKDDLPIWKFRADGKTFRAYDLLFKVRDHFMSDCSAETFNPIYFKREVNHGSNHSSHLYHINSNTKTIYSEVKRAKEPFFKDTIRYGSEILDLLAAAYYTRTLDYKNLMTGQKIKINLLVDNEIHRSYFKYLGKEIVDTRGAGMYRCHKISVFLLESDFFPEGEYMTVWISDDENRMPVMVETKILVGSVKALLDSYSGLKSTKTSIIKN